MHVPLMGSGSEVMASMYEGFDVTAVEKSTDMYQHAASRINRFVGYMGSRVTWAMSGADSLTRLLAASRDIKEVPLPVVVEQFEEVSVPQQPGEDQLEYWQQLCALVLGSGRLDTIEKTVLGMYIQ